MRKWLDLDHGNGLWKAREAESMRKVSGKQKDLAQSPPESSPIHAKTFPNTCQNLPYGAPGTGSNNTVSLSNNTAKTMSGCVIVFAESVRFLETLLEREVVLRGLGGGDVIETGHRGCRGWRGELRSAVKGRA